MLSMTLPSNKWAQVNLLLPHRCLSKRKTGKLNKLASKPNQRHGPDCDGWRFYKAKPSEELNSEVQGALTHSPSAGSESSCVCINTHATLSNVDPFHLNNPTDYAIVIILLYWWEKWTTHTGSHSGGGEAWIQLDPESHFSLETKYLQMEVVLMALNICLRAQRNSVLPEVLRQNSTGKWASFPSWQY